MFIPRAHVRLEHVFYKNHPRFKTINAKSVQKVTIRDLVQLPCLVPTIVSVILGCVIIIGGAMMCVIGYNPAMFVDTVEKENVTSALDSPLSRRSTEYIALKSMSYVGPILMGIGFFVVMVAVVLHCEIKDRFFGSITPTNNTKQLSKDQLYGLVLKEFRRNYFRGVEVPLQKLCLTDETMAEKTTIFKALSISTPALLLTPDVQIKWNNSNEKSPNENPKRKLRRKFKSQDSWLKTSSLPNIGHKNQHDSHGDDVKNVQHKPAKKMSKSCGPTIEIIQFPSSMEGNAGSAFDNPAFRDSPTEPKETDIRTLNPHPVCGENIQTISNALCDIVIHKAATYTECDFNTSQVRVPENDDCHSDIQNTFQRIIVKIKSCGNLKSEICPSECPVFLPEDDYKETTPLNKVGHRAYTKPSKSESLLFVPGNKRRKSYGESRSWTSLSVTKDTGIYDRKDIV